jgi:hypothetical protein
LKRQNTARAISPTQDPAERRVIHFDAQGSGLHVDLDELIYSRALVQANSGGGKTNALRQLLEETHGRVQHFVITPEDELNTLREKFDYVLVAARGGDLVASVRTAAMLCRRLVELGASAVIDVSELPASTPRGKPPTDRNEFVRLFLTELMNLPRALWRPILVVLDEAHHFAPEKGFGESVATDAVIDLCTRGRKRGFCAVLATQRLAAVHKACVAELNNKLIGRTGLDVDVTRAAKELGLSPKDAWEVLPKLEKGEFFVFGPAISVTKERVRTRFPLLTASPKRGSFGAAPPPPPAKVKAMLAQLADLPQEAEKQERTLETLEQENRSLRAELERAKEAQPAPKVDVVEVPVITASDRETLKGFFERASEDLKHAEAKFGAIAGALQMFGEKVQHKAAPQAHRPAISPPPPRPKPTSAEATRAPSSSLPKGARDMLLGLAQTFRPSLSRREVATLAGIKATTGTFRTYISFLKTNGLVEVSGDQLTITAAGLAAIGGRPPARTTDEIVATWAPKLPGSARVMLQALIEAFPRPLSREALAQRASISESTGSFRTYLSLLRTRGLAENTADGVVASATLFPERAHANGHAGALQ